MIACRCGHESAAHQHYRSGSDCALCFCSRLRRRFRTRSAT